MSKFKLLLSYREDLVKVLSALTADALLRFSKDLLRYGVITPDNMETLSSLDHPRLDSGTTVRYLLQLVYERIQLDSTLCNKFLEVMGSNREKGVAQVCRAITNQLASFIEESVSGDVTERVLLESDMEELWEKSIEVSHKWEEIAVLLKLPRATIEECRKASSNNLRLNKVLTEWVCVSHKQAKPPTLCHLKQALASPVVGECNMAKKIDCIEPPNAPPSKKQKIDEKTPFVIQFQSVNTEVGDCMSMLLEVQVSPKESVTYQWMKNEQPLSDGTAFSGTHSAILLIRNVSPIMQGQYYCHVSAGKEELNSFPVTVTIIYPPDKLALIKYYSNLKDVPDDSWPLVSSSTFIDLSLITTEKIKSSDSNFIKDEMANILKEKNKIDYSEAFCDYQIEALVLVEGRPGSGKTTLAHKITKDWAKGKILQNVSKLFLVSLRRDYDKLELFSTFFSSKSELYINELEESLGERTCFVLEGYDEYSHKDNQESIINKLIYKSYLPLAMVIVTSRPVATAATLRPKATSIIEILGFTREQFDQFIDSYPFRDLISKVELDSVKSHLKASTDVMNMCYLPLNANILCFLYDNLQKQQFLRTETQVYSQFVRAIILRKLLIANPLVNLDSLKDLPESEAQHFSQLCSLAFHMTVECQQVINELHVPFKASAVSSLLTIDKIVTLSGLKEVYSFLHLTLQEYLAAYHLANLDQHLQADIIKLHSGKDHMLNTFKFYCGLVDSEVIVKQFKDVVRNGINHLYMFHCAFQTQSDTICCKVLEILSGKIVLSGGLIITPVDFSVLGYVISNASDKVRLVTISPCLLYEDYNSGRWLDVECDTSDVKLYHFESTGVTSSLTFLKSYSCTQMSYTKQLNDVSERWKGWHGASASNLIAKYKTVLSFIPYTSDLFASDTAVPFANALKRCLNLENLIVVNLSKCMRSTSTISEVLKNCEKIQHLLIWGDCNYFGVATLITGLQHCKYLQNLNLINFDLSRNIAAIANVITHCEHMKSLRFLKCNINPEGAEEIAHALSDIKLAELAFPMNCIGSTGIRHLSQCLAQNPNCIRLELPDNGINSKGIKSLANVLNFLTRIQHIILSYNAVGQDGAAALVQGLKSSSNLKTLLLSHCNLTGCGIALIGEILHTHTNILHLDLSSNGTISTQEALALADGLSHLRLLELLHLSDNGIDCESAMALSRGIQHCPNLHTLDLSNNNISSDGIAAVNASIQCKKMQYVDYSRNEIGKESVDSIATLLKNHYLARLDLSHNNIGTPGARKLFAKLTTSELPTMINLLSNNIPSQYIEVLQSFCKSSSFQVLLTANTC